LFERLTGYRVKVIAVGSGQALEMGRRVTQMSSSRMRRTPNGSSPTQATSSVAVW